ncbi:MAG: DUF4332 domain-containing protein [Candidatus Thorarchaeota archaeon]|jgi:hypothetical protein
MDEEGFISYMKKKRKTTRTISSCVENAQRFEEFLTERGKTAEDSSEMDLDLFVSSILDGKNVAKFMWTLQYYFTYIEHDGMLKYSGIVREEHTAKKRKPFKLKNFKDVNHELVHALSAIGIETVDDMLKAGRTEPMRRELAEETGFDSEGILELSKLSNLTRLGAVKAVRARLYHDAGFDTLEKIASTTADELIEVTKEFIEKTGFEGIPPTPKEAANTVKTAKELSDVLVL